MLRQARTEMNMTTSLTRWIRLVVVAVCLTGSVLPARAQSADGSPQQPRRPRIGLALGGGSARGIAHIGVLKWFEEHHIPIDVIAGTSMGGLIAGAYASGMTPDEISAMMKAADWDLMFLSDSPYKYKTIRRKLDKRAFPSQLEFGLKHGFTLPGGLNPGQQVSLMLDEIALPYYDLKSFDDLPTPYRCVATDLRKSEAVVLDRPPLARAMRATMAIPGVFTPVTWEDWLLVDGGALNNIPADVVRNMGADVVIAVNVGADAATEETTKSLFALLGQTIDTMMSVGIRKGLEAADIVLDPDLKGLNSGSWRETDELAARGEQAAGAASDKLERYAMTPDEHAAFLKARQAKRRTTVPVPSYLTLESYGVQLSPRVERDIKRALAPTLNRPLTSDGIRPDLLAITGTDRFEYLSYTLTDQPTPTGLQVGVHQKPYGPPFLMLGIDLNNIDSSNFAFNLSGRILQYDWLGAGAETRLDFIVGTTQRFAGEIVKPLGSSKLFVAPRAYFDRRGRNFYSDDVLVAEYRFKQTGAGVDFGTDIGRSTEIRVGYDAANVRGRRRIGSPELPETSGSEQYANLTVYFDNQTSPIVPTKGARFLGRLKNYQSEPDIIVGDNLPNIPTENHYTTGEIQGSWFKTIRERDRLFTTWGAGTSFGDHPLINDFSLGGPFRLGSFNNDQLRGANYLLGVGGWLETGSAFNDWDTREWKNNGSAGIIMESLLGPIFGGVSVGFTGGARFYVAIGPLFR